MASEEQIQKRADVAEAGYDVDELKRRGRGAEPMQVRGDPGRAGPLRCGKTRPSVLKRGIAAEDAIQAAEWPLWSEPQWI